MRVAIYACNAARKPRTPNRYAPAIRRAGILVRALVFALLIAAALYLASRVLDHRGMSVYGFHFNRKWWTDLGFGLVLGMLLLFGVLVVELAVGWVSVTGSFAPSPGQPVVATILVGVVAVAAVAFGEEAAYRIPDQELRRGHRHSTVWGWSSLSRF